YRAWSGARAMIVALLNQPQGVGKMTLALHPAGLWSFRIRHVTVIDADPQGRTLEWSEMRAQERLPRRFTVIGLITATRRTSLVPWVACPGMDCAIAPPPRAALLPVDLVLVPVRLPPFVRVAFAETLRFVNEANTFRPRFRTRIVLNRRDAHDLDAHEIAQVLAKCDPPVLTSCIGRRAVLAEAVVTGLLAFEMAHSAAAVRKNCARGRSRKDGVMTTRDLKRTSMAHGCEADTSMHQPRANVSINAANAERCI